MLARKLAHLRLGHATERKQRAAQLLLRQPEKKIGLVLGAVSGTLQQPAPPILVKVNAGVVSGGNGFRANLLSYNE